MPRTASSSQGMSDRQAEREARSQDSAGSLASSPEAFASRRSGAQKIVDFDNPFDQLPGIIRRSMPMMFLELVTQGAGFLAGGLSKFFEQFDLDLDEFGRPQPVEALGPGGQDEKKTTTTGKQQIPNVSELLKLLTEKDEKDEENKTLVEKLREFIDIQQIQ